MIKFLKKILFLVITLIVVVLIAAIFIKKDFKVSKKVTVDLPQSEVFNYVRYLKNQEDYGVWNKLDPKMKKEYVGEDGTVGAIYTWDSKVEEAGKGAQEIVGIKEYEQIDYELRFERPWESKSDASIKLGKINDQSTEVTWTVGGKMPYPMNFFTLFMNIEEELGADLQQGLDNLKKNLESDQNPQ